MNEHAVLLNTQRGCHHVLSVVYAKATLAGSRLFQPSSASRTFSTALSNLKGGKWWALRLVHVQSPPN